MLKVTRKGYTRADGTKVKSTTYYTPDRGAPGRGPKTLPPISKKPSDSLSQYGYKLSKPASDRHNALDAAAKDKGVVAVTKRLNLIRNYTAPSPNKNKLSKDVEYMKKKSKK